MKYMISILLVLALVLGFLTLVVGCGTDTSPTPVDHQACLSCGCDTKQKSVELEEVMIEVQNNARECAVRVWGRASPSPLFEVKGALGIHNCKVYVIHNAEIKTKSNKLRGNE